MNDVRDMPCGYVRDIYRTQTLPRTHILFFSIFHLSGIVFIKKRRKDILSRTTILDVERLISKIIGSGVVIFAHLEQVRTLTRAGSIYRTI